MENNECTITPSEVDNPISLNELEKEVLHCNIIFYNDDNDIIGKLDWSSGKFIFTGEAEESAKIFFDFIKKYSNQLIKK
jgi:hypothetical protein